MKRMKLVMAAALALLALGALASGASALPEVLPGGVWTGATDAANPSWETAKLEKLICTKGTAEGTQTSNTLGAFHIKFEGCEAPAPKLKCNSLGDPSATVLWLGEYHFVFDSLAPLGAAILFLLEPIHIECNALLLLVVSGRFLCLALEPEVSRLTHLFHCEQESGVQKVKAYWNDEGVEVRPSLTVSKNEGVAESIGLLALYEMTYKEASSLMGV